MYEPCATTRKVMSDNLNDSANLDLVGKPIEKHKFSPWSLSQAYFAISGGFAADCSVFGIPKRVIFTPLGIVELAKLGILPDLSVDEVQDRSKADNIAKLIVCWQLFYFVGQVIARPIRGLPVTLLELHVLARIICVILLYVKWFKKPYDVKSPYFCPDQRVVDLASFFILQLYPEILPWRSEMVQTQTVEMKHILAMSALDEPDPRCLEHLRTARRALDFLKNHGLMFRWEVHDDTNAIYFRHQYVTSWLSDYTMVGSVCESGDTQRGEKKYALNSYIIAALSVAYGAGHLIAWNFAFPSTVEKWMWRASGLCCIAFPIANLILDYSTNPWQRGQRYKKIWRLAEESVGGVEILCYTVPLTLWPFARMFLFVEVFASLRNPAAGTYKTMEWTQFMPHVS